MKRSESSMIGARHIVGPVLVLLAAAVIFIGWSSPWVWSSITPEDLATAHAINPVATTQIDGLVGATFTWFEITTTYEIGVVLVALAATGAIFCLVRPVRWVRWALLLLAAAVVAVAVTTRSDTASMRGEIVDYVERYVDVSWPGDPSLAEVLVVRSGPGKVIVIAGSALLLLGAEIARRNPRPRLERFDRRFTGWSGTLARRFQRRDQGVDGSADEG